MTSLTRRVSISWVLGHRLLLPYSIYRVLGSEPRASDMQGKCPTKWATSPSQATGFEASSHSLLCILSQIGLEGWWQGDSRWVVCWHLLPRLHVHPEPIWLLFFFLGMQSMEQAQFYMVSSPNTPPVWWVPRLYDAGGAGSAASVLRSNLCPSLNLILFPLAEGRLFSQERGGNSCSQCWKLNSVTCLSDSFIMAFPPGQAQRKQETSMWGEMVFPLNLCLGPNSLHPETKARETSWFCSNFSKDNDHRGTVWYRKRKINGNITLVPFSMDEKCLALKTLHYEIVIDDKGCSVGLEKWLRG